MKIEFHSLKLLIKLNLVTNLNKCLIQSSLYSREYNYNFQQQKSSLFKIVRKSLFLPLGKSYWNEDY